MVVIIIPKFAIIVLAVTRFRCAVVAKSGMEKIEGFDACPEIATTSTVAMNRSAFATKPLVWSTLVGKFFGSPRE
jgi:hypothetical protein